MAIMIYPPTAKVVGKNMLKINRTLGIVLIVTIADIVLSFIGFAGVGMAAVTTRGAVPMWCTAIPFATFVLGGASLVIIGRKRGLYAGATALWERVRNTEKAAMASFASAQQPVFIEETKRTITKMVEVGLLPEHEIVGECVAKKSLGMTPDEADAEYRKFLTTAMPESAIATMLTEERAPKFCPQCGAALENQHIAYCPYCGVRIRGGGTSAGGGVSG